MIVHILNHNSKIPLLPAEGSALHELCEVEIFK